MLKEQKPSGPLVGYQVDPTTGAVSFMVKGSLDLAPTVFVIPSEIVAAAYATSMLYQLSMLGVPVAIPRPTLVTDVPGPALHRRQA